VTTEKTERRSLKYIRLAAYLAARPLEEDRVVMTLEEVEELVGETLPANAKFPSWWRNDDRRMHARAWLTAGWEVVEMKGDDSKVVFSRRAES
jgi:hypothetical protein